MEFASIAAYALGFAICLLLYLICRGLPEIVSVSLGASGIVSAVIGFLLASRGAFACSAIQGIAAALCLMGLIASKNSVIGQQVTSSGLMWCAILPSFLFLHGATVIGLSTLAISVHFGLPALAAVWRDRHGSGLHELRLTYLFACLLGIGPGIVTTCASELNNSRVQANAALFRADKLIGHRVAAVLASNIRQTQGKELRSIYMVVQSGCHWCDVAKSDLTKSNIEFVEIGAKQISQGYLDYFVSTPTLLLVENDVIMDVIVGWGESSKPLAKLGQFRKAGL